MNQRWEFIRRLNLIIIAIASFGWAYEIGKLEWRTLLDGWTVVILTVTGCFTTYTAIRSWTWKRAANAGFFIVTALLSRSASWLLTDGLAVERRVYLSSVWFIMAWFLGQSFRRGAAQQYLIEEGNKNGNPS